MLLNISLTAYCCTGFVVRNKWSNISRSDVPNKLKLWCSLSSYIYEGCWWLMWMLSG